MNDYLYLPEIHKFQLKGKNIVLDVNTSRVFSIDELVYDILSIAQGKQTNEIVLALAPKYDQLDITTALEELEALRLIKKEPFVFPPFTVKYASEHPLRHLDLIVSQDCNMRCRYCFAETGSYKGQRTLMSSEVARRAIEFLISRSKEETKLHATFFGGEPLLNVPVLKETIEYSELKAKEAGKRISFSISTNGTLFTQELIEYLDSKNVNVQVSIDGDEKAQNKNRPYYGNLPSYPDVCRNVADLVRLTKRRIGARTTVTSWTIPSLFRNAQHLLSLGFHSVHIEPASGAKGKIFIKTNDQVETLKRQFDQMADYLLEKMMKKEYVGFHNFVRVLQALNINSRKIHPCGAGRGYVCVGANGDLFPCHRFVGNPKYLMGNVMTDTYNSYWEEKITNEVAVMNRDACKACWARYLCGGDCIAVAEEYHGDITIPDSAKCALNKYVIELALMIYAHIPKQEKSEIETIYELPNKNQLSQNQRSVGSI